MDTSSANPPKTGVYSRSAAFRWGVWMVALAAVIIGWTSLRESVTQEKLQTAEGTLVDYGPVPGPSQKPLNLLRLQKPDETLLMFGSWEALRDPKAGWQKGQPIRVTYDVRKKLYEVVVAGEVILDTQPPGSRTRKVLRLVGVILFLIGVPLAAVAYVSSRRTQ